MRPGEVFASGRGHGFEWTARLLRPEDLERRIAEMRAMGGFFLGPEYFQRARAIERFGPEGEG